jgi:hypothetical protein
MMIGTKLWHSCLDESEVDECARKVAHELGDRGRKGNTRNLESRNIDRQCV